MLTIHLAVEPAFRLLEVQETFTFDRVVEHLDEFIPSAEHVRLWWFPSSGSIRVSTSNRTREPPRPAGSWLWGSLFGYHVIQFFLFLGRYLTCLNPLIGKFASWLVRDKSIGIDDGHRIFNVDCKYPQHTTEWAIPIEQSRSCLRELRAWLDEEHADPDGLRPHFPIEIRFSAADDIWLSPSSDYPTCWIGIVQYKPYGFNVPYKKLFERFEAILMRHHGRPHWAKAHQLRPDSLRKLYPRFDDFIRVLEDYDPSGLFRNPYIQRHLFDESGLKFDGRVFKEL